MYSLVSLLSGIYPFPAMHSLLVTIIYIPSHSSTLKNLALGYQLQRRIVVIIKIMIAKAS